MPTWSRESGERIAADCREAVFERVDVSDPESVAALYAAATDHFGDVDILYNNAGIMPPDDDSILTTDADAWDRVQAVNAKGVFLCCKFGIPRLLERSGGSVINVASFVALMGAATSQIAYTASKGAVLSMSRELAVQFARQGVRVNALCPGPVETPLLMRLFSDDPTAYERRRVHLPMGRLATAREIVPARRAVSGQRRVVLRQRRHLPGRRRPQRRVRDAGIGARGPGAATSHLAERPRQESNLRPTA